MTTEAAAHAAAGLRTRARRGGLAAAVDAIIFGGLLALVMLAPLPAGGYRPWAWSLLALAASGLLTIWASAALAAGRDVAASLRPVRVAVLLYLAALGWAVVQWLPWTPSAWHHPVWAEAADMLGRDLSGRITVNPGATLTGIVRLAGYAAVFLLAFHLSLDRRRARAALVAIAVACTAYAAYGLIAHAWPALRIAPVALPVPDHLTSVFGNRNSFATYAGLGLVCLLGLILRELHVATAAAGTWRSRLAAGVDLLLGRGVPLVIGLLAIGAALVLTASRGGIVSAAFGLVILLLAGVRARRLSAVAAGLVAVFTLALSIALVAIWGQGLSERAGDLAERLLATDGAGVGADTRLLIYGTTWHAAADTPLLGTGLGTFADVFPHYRPAEMLSDLHYDLAHSSYLENLLELGGPGALALVLAVTAGAALCWRGLTRRRRALEFPMIGLGATGVVGLHAWVDFSLQIPAVAMTYALLMGACCAQSLPTAERGFDGRTAGAGDREVQGKSRQSSGEPAGGRPEDREVDPNHTRR